VRLCSGLGNQLFQFACGLAEAGRRGASLAFDTTWYPIVARVHRPVRRLRLREIGLTVHESFHGWRRWMIGLAAAAFDRTGRGRSFLERAGNMTVIQEMLPLRRQCRESTDSMRDVYLNGYWQTSDHFLAVREQLQRIIPSPLSLSPGAEELTSRIAGRKTGFIHIRRGDYKTLVGDAGLLPLTYYKKAVEAVRGDGWHWLVFSEDEDWARQNVGFLPSWQLVAYESENRDIEDLQLMAACEAGIIANSSYSWWGAALGDHPGRPIVAPDRYWGNSGSTTCDWVLPGWLRLAAWD
jgi:hypothetical protein